MSVSYSTVTAVGFAITGEELKQGYEIIEAMGKDAGEWQDTLFDNYLITLDCYNSLSDYYIFATESQEVGEGCCTSILELSRGINYRNYSDLINLFKEFFPALSTETHQLDLFVGLKVS